MTIATNDPIRLSDLQYIYGIMDDFIQPNAAISEGPIYPDLSSGYTMAVDITSTNWTEISPSLSVTINVDGQNNYLIIVPILINGVSANVVGELGIGIDGADPLFNAFRFNSNAAASQGMLNGSYVFILGLTVGQHTIKPMMRVISGTTPTIRARYTQSMRTIVKAL